MMPLTVNISSIKRRSRSIASKIQRRCYRDLRPSLQNGFRVKTKRGCAAPQCDERDGKPQTLRIIMTPAPVYLKMYICADAEAYRSGAKQEVAV